MGNFKPDPSFDDLAPTTTKGDIIARDTSTNVRIPVGANGLFLQAASGSTGGVSWASPSGALAYFSLGGATTLPQLNTFYAMNASTAAFSVTLPTSGSTGSFLGLKKVDITLNGITLVGPIDGGSLYNLATINEELGLRWDGSAYKIENHFAKTPLATYAPAFFAFGTVTGSSAVVSSERDGKFLNIYGEFTAGTPGSSPCAMSIGFGGSNAPVGLQVDFSLGGSTYRPVGMYGSVNTPGTHGWIVTMGSDRATLISFSPPFSMAGATLGSASGSSLGGAGNKLVFGSIKVPISGWQP